MYFILAPMTLSLCAQTHTWSGTSLSRAQIFGIAFGVLVIACCAIGQVIGLYCYRDGACRSSTTYSSHHSSNHHAPHNHTTDFHLSSLYTVGPVSTSQTYYPSSSRQQTQPDNVYNNNNIIVTSEPSAPPLEAVTHASEAPPAYHTAVHYKTVAPDTEDVQLSKDLALSDHPTSTTESDAPPAYKEAHD